MKDFFEKMKQKGSKRMIENAVIFLVLLVIVIIVINNLYESEEVAEPVAIGIPVEKDKNDTLEERLETILKMIEGAGKVDVMISYSTSEEKVPIYDISENTTITEEKDKEGGTRKTESKNTEQKMIFEEMGNNKQPFIKQTMTPKVIGVIIVADGASNVKVKENLINAVLAVLDVPSHRIQVFSRQK